MANETSTLFTKKAAEKLRSPDDLDRYVRVTNPSVWVVLVACVALIAGLLIWGVFGSVTTSVSTTGVSVKGTAMCFLSAEDAAKVNTGDSASVGGKRMKVASVSSVPLSREEAGKVLDSDYLVSTLMDGDWAYQVTFEGEGGLDQGVPLVVSIITERVAPISLILRGSE